ncbi:hypothetical protein [Schaalia vaccimaxillae]|uniref:hypothetical protein n=1 Tax=Schaalia vaccimaxillae TaxID=183916 RepID=UPI0003B5AAE6|nr:hypothetical protein [Schaalia vaccimaxillae]
MTIEDLVDPAPALVAVAARRPEVSAAFDAASQALTQLRFHEGLRRRWQEARAEAAVREATGLAIMAGVRITVDDMRVLSMRQPGDTEERLDPGQQLALGIWRSQWNMVSSFDPINQRIPVRRSLRPFPALTASVHRDICSAQVESGLTSSRSVAIPSDSMTMMRAGEYVRADMPALACAGALLAHFRFRQVFSPASVAVGGALARWVLVSRGVDPTAVAVISALDAQDQSGAARELAGWVSADEAGVGRWLIRVAQSVAYGAEVGRDVALRVQAGRLG